MSLVTNFVFKCCICEDVPAVEAHLNAYLLRDGQTHDRSAVKDLGPFKDAYGGTRCLETPLWVGAFNYLDVLEFVKHLRAYPWRYPERVQLLAQGDEDDVFTERFHARVDDAA
jgi:hypothetical protein